MQKTTVKKGSSESKAKTAANQTKKNNTPVKNLSEEEYFESCESCKVIIQCIDTCSIHQLTCVIRFKYRSMYRIFPKKLTTGTVWKVVKIQWLKTS